jgi:hypothetical protein
VLVEIGWQIAVRHQFERADLHVAPPAGREFDYVP